MLIRLWRRTWPFAALGLIVVAACVWQVRSSDRLPLRARLLYGYWRPEVRGYSLTFWPPDRYQAASINGSECGRFSLIGQDMIALKPDSGAPEQRLTVHFTPEGLKIGPSAPMRRRGDSPPNLCVPAPTWVPEPPAPRPAYLPPATLTPTLPLPSYPPPVTSPPLTPPPPRYPSPATPTP